MRYLVIVAFLLANAMHMNAQIVREMRINTSSSINTVKINGVTAVCLLTGSTYKVEIETESANQPYITVTKNNHQLEIEAIQKFKSRRCIAYITMPNNPVTIIAKNIASCYTNKNCTLELDNLQFDAQSVARINMNLIAKDVFNCTLNAVAYTEMTGFANQCKFDFNSTTDVKMEKFKINDLDLIANSSIFLNLYVSKRLKSKVHSVMHFNLEGQPLIVK